MRYIGNKTKLVNWIYEIMTKYCNEQNYKEMTFADLFAGTGSVSFFMKDKFKKIITNDLEYYSYVINKFYIENNFEINPKISFNKLEGAVFKNYSPNEKLFGRMFFTEENAKSIDGFRDSIEKQYKEKLISENEYFCLLTTLIEAVDKVSNTTSVYGAYLKEFQKNSLNEIQFKIPYTKIISGQVNQVYNQDANKLIKEISGDILYLDPPYNHRQYSSNYHILNNILKNENFISDKKSGVNSSENKSKYSQKKEAKNQLEELIKNAKFKYIFISYNNEGIISLNEFNEICEKYGDYFLEKKEYKRYKSNSSEADKSTFEYLHVLIKKIN